MSLLVSVAGQEVARDSWEGGGQEGGGGHLTLCSPLLHHLLHHPQPDVKSASARVSQRTETEAGTYHSHYNSVLGASSGC